jgi:intracellular septation protein
MAATVLQMAIIWLRERRLQPMQKATLVLILLFGALTLALHDDRFIKWKPTVLYGAMAISLAAALWVFKKNFLKMLLGEQLELPAAVWGRLNVAWIAYCLFMAVLNGYVAATFSTAAWVDFKLWGYVFPIVFLVAQGLYISPHLKSDKPAA